MIARIYGLLIFVFLFSLLFTAHNIAYSSEATDTLTTGPSFDSIEYNFTLNSNVIELTDEDSKEIMRKKIENSKSLNTLFKFIKKDGSERKLKSYKVVFLDTKKNSSGKRKLEENNYILRVRTRMEKNEKRKERSDFTVKNRSKNINEVRVLTLGGKEYGDSENDDDPKKEIDINGDNSSYAVSNKKKFEYNKYFNESGEIDNVELVTKCMKGKAEKLYGFIKALIGDSGLIVPGVVDRYKIKCNLKALETPEFDLEIWVFKKDDKKEYLVSLSFKGDIEDKDKDLELYKEISEKLKETDLLSNEQVSKTKRYFDFFAESK